MANKVIFTYESTVSISKENGEWIKSLPVAHLVMNNKKISVLQSYVDGTNETSNIMIDYYGKEVYDFHIPKVAQIGIETKFSMRQWNHIRIDYLIEVVYGVLDKNSFQYKQLYMVGKKAKPEMFYTCLKKLKEDNVL